MGKLYEGMRQVTDVQFGSLNTQSDLMLMCKQPRKAIFLNSRARVRLCNGKRAAVRTQKSRMCPKSRGLPTPGLDYPNLFSKIEFYNQVPISIVMDFRKEMV